MALQNEFQQKFLERLQAAKSADTDAQKNAIVQEMINMMRSGELNVNISNMPEGVTVENLDVISAAIVNAVNKLGKKSDVKDGFNSLAEKMEAMKTLNMDSFDRLPKWLMFILHEFFSFSADGKQKDRELMNAHLEEVFKKIFPEMRKALDGKLKLAKPDVKVTVKPTPVQFQFDEIVTALNRLERSIPSVDSFNMDRLSRLLSPLTKLNTSARNPLGVRLSDGEKYIKFFKELRAVLEDLREGNQQMVAFAGGPREVSIDPNTAVKEAGYSSIGDGRTTVTTAGTRVQLSTSNIACKKIVVTAETDNTDIVTVGGSTVVAALATRRGTPLFTAQAATFFVDNLNKLYIDSLVDGEGVTYVYYN